MMHQPSHIQRTDAVARAQDRRRNSKRDAERATTQHHRTPAHRKQAAEHSDGRRHFPHAGRTLAEDVLFPPAACSGVSRLFNPGSVHAEQSTNFELRCWIAVAPLILERSNVNLADCSSSTMLWDA